MEFANAEGGVALAEDVVEQHLDLVGGELDGGDGGGGFGHLGRDGGPAAEVGLRGLGGGGLRAGEGEEGAGKSVLPRPAAVVTARRRRRVASIG